MNEKRMAESKAAHGISILHRAILLGSLSFGILAFSLPIYARQMGANAMEIGGMISIFALIVTIARPLVGWGIDRIGRKPFLVVSFVFYAIAMGLFAIAQNVSMLYLARFVQGLGSSLLWIPAYTVATELSEYNWGRAVARMPKQRPADADLPGLQSHVRYSIFKERRHVEHFPRGGKRTGNLAVVEKTVN